MIVGSYRVLYQHEPELKRILVLLFWHSARRNPTSKDLKSVLRTRLQLLFAYEIRRYDPRGNAWDNRAFYFNLAESAVWFVIALLVLNRWRKHRRTSEELVFAGLFIVTDLAVMDQSN